MLLDSCERQIDFPVPFPTFNFTNWVSWQPDSNITNYILCTVPLPPLIFKLLKRSNNFLLIINLLILKSTIIGSTWYIGSVSSLSDDIAVIYNLLTLFTLSVEFFKSKTGLNTVLSFKQGYNNVSKVSAKFKENNLTVKNQNFMLENTIGYGAPQQPHSTTYQAL